MRTEGLPSSVSIVEPFCDLLKCPTFVTKVETIVKKLLVYED